MIVRFDGSPRGGLTGILLACVLLTGSVSSQEAQTPVPGFEGADPTQWVMVEDLSDEFEGPGIDPKKWNNNPPDWGPWSWKPENTRIEDGTLRLTIAYEEHEAKRPAPGGILVPMDLYYTSGIVRSWHTLTYGYYEARIKGVPTFPGSSPAFWIYSVDDEMRALGLYGDQEGDVTYAEIDIVELQQAEDIDGDQTRRYPVNVMEMNLHKRVIEDGKEVWKRPNKNPEAQKTKVFADFDPRDDFHTYAARVTDDEIVWYLDGKEVGRKPNTSWHKPFHVTLSLGLRYPHVTYFDCPYSVGRCPVPEEARRDGYPADMEIDYVRVYEPRVDILH